MAGVRYSAYLQLLLELLLLQLLLALLHQLLLLGPGRYKARLVIGCRLTQ